MMITKNLFLVRFKGMILMNKLKQVSLSSTLSVPLKHIKCPFETHKVSLSSTLSVPLKQQVSMCQYVSVCVYYVSVCVNFIENKAKCLWME
mgnify:CR=1 FL=1